MNIEAKVLKVPTGVQDYRPAMYGGLAAIEMATSGINRVPIEIDTRELEKRLLLVYTGQSRNSGINNWEVTKKHIDGDPETTKTFDEIRDIAGAMRTSLLSGDWPGFGAQLNREWTVRKRLAPNVTTPQLDNLVSRSFQAGAAAAKVCGAGGGGCLIVFGEPGTLATVSSALKQDGATILDYRIEANGLSVTVEE
jgi:D-glycero-alpha-D-manno-heptose-7-phosphate kinase